MTQHWQEILPVDHYIVTANGLLHEYDRKILTFLYQPLIGTACISLYMTLWAEVEENRLWSESHSHHSLMNFMATNLKEIYNSRLKLEGIGLLKTYVKKDEEQRSFIYELQPPLTPEQFLNDGMLNIYLYRKIGKSQFIRVKRFFSEKTVQDMEYQQVTKAFQDVFSSSHPSIFSYDEEINQDISEVQGEQFIGRNDPRSIQVVSNNFNFDLLLAGLHENLISKSAFTTKVRDVINILSFLYGIDAIEMKKIVMSSITADNEISIEELRKSARDWYQFEHQDKLPALIEKTQPAIYQNIQKEPSTKEEKLIHYFERTSPLQFMKDISGGAEPSKADVKMIEDILLNQKLNPGVVNVLIDYVLRKTDMKLTKNYVEKIASHWARKNINTVKESMELAKTEHRQYLEWGGKNGTKQVKSKRKPLRTEILPDWFEDEENSSHQSNKTESIKTTVEDNELKKKEIESMLKKLRS